MVNKDDIELIEIVEVEERPNKPGSGRATIGPYWKVTLAIKDHYGVILQGTWFLSKKEIPDSSVLPIARSYMHCLCKDIAESTPEWVLDQAQFEALKKHPQTPQS
jgi:hypothetical protein